MNLIKLTHTNREGVTRSVLVNHFKITLAFPVDGDHAATVVDVSDKDKPVWVRETTDEIYALAEAAHAKTVDAFHAKQGTDDDR
jgi:hypothetical protein